LGRGNPTTGPRRGGGRRRGAARAKGSFFSGRLKKTAAEQRHAGSRREGEELGGRGRKTRLITKKGRE